ncbi:MAG: hypothetical protein CVU09_05850 [Bacteroidetes bacterium HGW-Bacteroidetes-4]|jgi:hypothetical protein|nr:MAG: hypothetical protein CVU09_05850 [Bacteroidetes bacterium HGW-Bacteroidetes-4]
MRTLKTLTFGMFALFVSIAASAQQKTEVRNVKGFSGIDVSEGIRVELTYGDKEYVEVTTDEGVMERVITELKGNDLRIHMEGNNWNGWNIKVLVKVTAVKMERLEASSGSSIITQNLLESNKLEMSSSSGASLKVAFKSPVASCKTSSGASADLKGETQTFSAKSSSGSSIDAELLKADKVDADVSSGASIEVTANEELKAEASSGGTIKYSGSPKMKDIEKSSGGSVRSN